MLLCALFGVISWTAVSPAFTADAVPLTTALAPSADTSMACPVTATVVPKIFSIKGAKKLVISWVPLAKYTKILNPKNAKIKTISNHVVKLIFFKLSKNPPSLPKDDPLEETLDCIGELEDRLGCNIESVKLLELEFSIIIKIYIIIFYYTPNTL